MKLLLRILPIPVITCVFLAVFAVGAANRLVPTRQPEWKFLTLAVCSVLCNILFVPSPGQPSTAFGWRRVMVNRNFENFIGTLTLIGMVWTETMSILVPIFRTLPHNRVDLVDNAWMVYGYGIALALVVLSFWFRAKQRVPEGKIVVLPNGLKLNSGQFFRDFGFSKTWPELLPDNS